MEKIRFGVLGAARIVPAGLLQPARQVVGVDVVAIGARDGERARAFARKHGIERAYAGYEDVIADAAVTAVYIALPNGLHAEWAQRALAAGKHVLCEKPLAANADEAETLVAAALASGRVFMEAFHWRYHPLAQRLAALVREPAAGPILSLAARFRTPMLRREDIRFDYALGGGAAMDLGCYLVNMLRFATGEEPTVDWAHADLLRPTVDRRMRAGLRFAGGAAATLDCEMGARGWPQVDLTITCAQRTIQVVNPVLPQIYHRLRVRDAQGGRSETVARTPTYVYQMEAFAAAVRGGAPVPSDAADGLRNMRVIDALYVAAGLPRRGELGAA